MQAAKMSGLAEGSHGETKRSGFTPTGNRSPVSRPCTMGQRLHPGNLGMTETGTRPEPVQRMSELTGNTL